MSISYTKIYFGLILFCVGFLLFGCIYTTVLQKDMNLLQRNIRAGGAQRANVVSEILRNFPSRQQKSEETQVEEEHEKVVDHLVDCPFTIKRPDVETIEYRDEGHHWQAQAFVPTNDTDDRVYGIHAYYDDRPNFNGSVYIRLFVVTAGLSTAKLMRSTHCYLWTKAPKLADGPLVVRSTVTCIDGKRRVVVKGKVFHNFIVSCSVPQQVFIENLTITHVSFVPTPCANTTVYIQVTYPPKPTRADHVFGMCEANGVSFGYFGPEQALWLVEWFETNRLFGVTEFNIYNGTMQLSPPVRKVFDYYDNNGMLLLHHQPPPIHGYSSSDVSVADIAMRTSLNDCLYRNMYRYNYAVTIDMDELIVPQHHDNYTHMIVSRTGNDTWSKSFSFPGMALFKTFTGAKDEAQESSNPLKTSAYLYGVPDKLRPKTIFSPRFCLAAFSHYCLHKIPGSQREHGFVSGKVAKVYHYRRQCFKQSGRYSLQACEDLQKLKQYSGRMLDFQAAIYKRFIHVVRQLGLEYLINFG